MTEPTPIGPYMNEDGDWWVPLEAASFREARSAILGCIGYSIPQEGTLIYRGKEVTWLGGADTYDRDNQRYVLAWHFEENVR